MIVMLIVLTVVTLLSMFAEKAGKRDTVTRKVKIDKNVMWLIIIFLSVVSGFRYMNYYLTDEWTYRIIFESYKGTSFFSNFTFDEPGYYILNWILANTIGNSQILILICAFVTNMYIVKAIEKKAQYFTMSVFIYIAGGFFFASMNIMRQYLVVALFFYIGYDLIKEGKLFKYFIFVGIAVLFHKSSVILLPLYFVLRIKKKKWLYMASVFGSVLIMVLFQYIVPALVRIVGYTEFLDSAGSLAGRGVSPIRVGFWIIFNFAILVTYHRLDLQENEKIVYRNVTVVSIILWLLSLKYVYIARCVIYLELLEILFIPSICKLFKSRYRKVINLLIVVLFLIFAGYEMFDASSYHNILLEKVNGTLYMNGQ